LPGFPLFLCCLFSPGCISLQTFLLRLVKFLLSPRERGRLNLAGTEFVEAGVFFFGIFSTLPSFPRRESSFLINDSRLSVPYTAVNHLFWTVHGSGSFLSSPPISKQGTFSPYYRQQLLPVLAQFDFIFDVFSFLLVSGRVYGQILLFYPFKFQKDLLPHFDREPGLPPTRPFLFEMFPVPIASCRLRNRTTRAQARTFLPFFFLTCPL